MTTENLLYADLEVAKELLYDKCGFELTNFKLHSESLEYGACSFELDGKKIAYRVSKITPTKTGQFVTLWKRNKSGVTAPFDILDDFDFVIITSRSANKIGQFIFPKSALAGKGIITRNGKDGKRGIRVYPPWDSVTNKQAEKTQNWQTEYFVKIDSNNAADVVRVKEIFAKSAVGSFIS